MKMHYTWRVLLGSCFFTLWLASCHKQDSPASAPSFSADSSSLTLSAVQGSKDSFDIVSNVAWTINGLPGWTSVSPSSGTGSAKVYVTAAQANQGTAALTASFSVTPSGTGVQAKTISLKLLFPPIEVTSFSPLHAAAGATITITGQGFSTTASQNSVTINGVAATLTSATATSLTVVVPNKVGTGNILVTANGQSATAANAFTYDKSWQVSVIAGISGTPGRQDGPALSATFWRPLGIVIDNNGNLYIADNYGPTVRKINTSGMVSTFAGTSAAGGNSPNLFNDPAALAIQGNNLLVTDLNSQEIRSVNLSNPSAGITTLANGIPYPYGIAADANNYYVTEYSSGLITKVSSAGITSTFASGLNNPVGIAKDNTGNFYVTESGDIKKISSSGSVSTFASGLASPYDVKVDSQGNVYVTEETNSDIKIFNSSGQLTTTITGSLISPAGIVLDSSGTIYVTDFGNYTVNKIVYE